MIVSPHEDASDLEPTSGGSLIRSSAANESILISDWAGHGFTTELARFLKDERRVEVLYSYCATVSTPKGRLEPGDSVIAVPSGGSFEKYRLRRRLMSELRYGWNTARVALERRPNTHVVCNMPLVSMFVIWVTGATRRIRLVVWFQDAQAGIVEGVLGRGVIARSLGVIEGFLLRRAHRVIAISPELAEEAQRRGVKPERVVVIENWSPIEGVPQTPRDNPWSREHRLAHRPVLLYSGTLGKKHRAEVLAELARAVGPVGAAVVVVSEGEGAAELSAAKESASDLDNLLVLPYQPFERLAEVLGTADVLLALLEPSAGPFSVPSKVLSYLCAGRAVLAAVPSTNTAAKLLTERAMAGVVVQPGDDAAFCAAALELLEDERRRQEMGTRGRSYAESNFRADDVADRFLTALRF